MQHCENVHLLANSWRSTQTIKNKPSPAKFRHRHSPPSIGSMEPKCMLTERRPPVPKTLLPAPHRSEKNFVKDNVQRASTIQARPTPPMLVVTCRGLRQDLSTYNQETFLIEFTNSSSTAYLEGRKLREREEFGHIPKYLMLRKKLFNQREEELKHLTKEVECDLRQISHDERCMLLQGLKERWIECNKEFQVLPVLCDTPAKIKAKLRLEKQLATLEKDIQLLEANPHIFVNVQARSPKRH